MRRFACQPGCTKCCERGGLVYLSERDLQQIAAYLGISATDFEAEYVVRYRHVLRLRISSERRRCRFLTENGCAIHPVKPVQCRTYPFWPTLVEDRTVWKEEGKFCPGIGQGDLVQIKAAREIASELPVTFPTLGCF